MTRLSGTPRAAESEWGCEFLRFTLFHPPGPAPGVAGLWGTLTGLDPNSSIEKPKTKERVEIGAWDGTQLVLHAQPQVMRIDWICNVNPDDSPQHRSLPDRLNSFVGLMNKWLGGPNLPRVTRAALGTVALLRVSDPEAGLQRVSTYLNFDIVGERISDFLYQINRRRDSLAAPGFEVNRLVKWSVARAGKLTLTVSEEGLMGVTEPDPGETFLRLETDINTVPKPNEDLPAGVLQPLVGEFSGWTMEIVREGDE